MNQEKIGKFITQKTKEKNITQSTLAEMLNVSNRAISKWENGVCLPDASNMQELCQILGITINDLFSGEVVDLKEREERLEKNLIEMMKLKEQSDGALLILEVFIGITISIVLTFSIIIPAFLNIDNWLKVAIITFGIVIFAIGFYYTLKIEQIAGFYECSNCHYKYIPTYKQILLATHINRTRKIKCPKCHKRCWHRKVINK